MRGPLREEAWHRRGRQRSGRRRWGYFEDKKQWNMLGCGREDCIERKELVVQDSGLMVE